MSCINSSRVATTFLITAGIGLLILTFLRRRMFPRSKGIQVNLISCVLRMYVCMYVYASVCVLCCVCTYVRVRLYVCVCARVCVCVRAHACVCAYDSGLHLGNDSRGGKIRFYESRGGDDVKIRMCKHTASRGVWGHAPRKFLYLRLSQIASGAFSGTILSCNPQ